MKRYLNFRFTLLLPLFALLALPTLAQRPGPGPNGPRMAQVLDLTDAQKEQLKTLRENQRETFRDWREANPNATREDARAWRENQRATHEAALRNILTSEQQTKLDNLQARAEARRAERGERGQRGDRRMRGERGPRGDAALNLSDDQKEALKSLREEQRTAFQDWRDANPNATREDAQAWRASQREVTKTQLEDILSTEQLQQIEANQGMRKQRPGRRAAQGMARMSRALDLTDAQREAVRETMTAQRETAKAWREANPNATREDRRAFMEQQREAMRSSMESILTPAQRAKAAELREQRREKRGNDGERRNRRGARQNQGSGAATQQATPAANFSLENYPNPFNPSTEIRFTLDANAQVNLAVFDLQGREVAQLLNGTFSAGQHQATFDASNLPSGTYLYRLNVDGLVQTGRMTLTK